MVRTVLFASLVFVLAPHQQVAPRTPVLVELFTSEGCSSCPPADALLSSIAREQPVPGAEIVPLELHVTYWDNLGWKDPASLQAATARQQAYARTFNLGDIYTPQTVIDGRAQEIGSDEAAIKKAVAKAAAQPHVRLALAPSVDGVKLDASVTFGRATSSRGACDLLVAVVEDGVTSAVRSGENGGRTLHHDAVVRAIAVTPIGGEVNSAHVPLTLDPKWPREHLRVVAALQERSGHILGATIATLH